MSEFEPEADDMTPVDSSESNLCSKACSVFFGDGAPGGIRVWPQLGETLMVQANHVTSPQITARTSPYGHYVA